MIECLLNHSATESEYSICALVNSVVECLVTGYGALSVVSIHRLLL